MTAAMSSEASVLELQLYHTAGCHLCEQAEALVLPLMEQQGWVLQRTDIADDEALMERYAMRIPVLRNPRCALELGWPFDVRQVLELLER